MPPCHPGKGNLEIRKFAPKRIIENPTECTKKLWSSTAQGRLRVSRNALRHGLAVIAHRAPAVDTELDRVATAIGGEYADPAQRERALIIAETELTLLRVRAMRTNIFEQMLLAAGAEDVGEPSEPLQPRLRTRTLLETHVEQLRRLERYERRAFSRRQCAIRRLLDLWVERGLNFKLLKMRHES